MIRTMYVNGSFYCPNCKGYTGHFTSDRKALRCGKCKSEFALESGEVVLDGKLVECFSFTMKGTVYMYGKPLDQKEILPNNNREGNSELPES